MLREDLRITLRNLSSFKCFVVLIVQNDDCEQNVLGEEDFGVDRIS